MQIVNLLKIAILKQMFVIQSIRTLGEYFLQYILSGNSSKSLWIISAIGAKKVLGIWIRRIFFQSKKIRAASLNFFK